MWRLPWCSYFNTIHTSSALHSGESLIWQHQKGRLLLASVNLQEELGFLLDPVLVLRRYIWHWSETINCRWRLAIAWGSQFLWLVCLCCDSAERMFSYVVISSFASIVSSLSADLHAEEAASAPLRRPFPLTKQLCRRFYCYDGASAVALSPKEIKQFIRCFWCILGIWRKYETITSTPQQFSPPFTSYQWAAGMLFNPTNYFQNLAVPCIIKDLFLPSEPTFFLQPSTLLLLPLKHSRSGQVRAGECRGMRLGSTFPTLQL